jgi:hypothetical protein
MNLREYYEQFHKHLTGESGPGFPMHIAAEVAAAHSIGLSFEQLQQFLARRTEITSVAIALKGNTLPAEKIERILDARRIGVVQPNDVLFHAFAPDEIHEKSIGTAPDRPSGDA